VFPVHNPQFQLEGVSGTTEKSNSIGVPLLKMANTKDYLFSSVRSYLSLDLVHNCLNKNRNMRWVIFTIVFFLIISFNNSSKAKISNQNEVDLISNSDTIGLAVKLNYFDAKFNSISRELSDSVAKIRPNDVDFSDITTGLEREYNKCKDEFEKVLHGYKLAVNCYLTFRNGGNIDYRTKAELLFYNFVNFKKGIVASKYLGLDINKVNFISANWNSFSEENKKEILFYGLLRGFHNGLPDVLKNIK
jgi:hypothetical protein